MAAQPGRADNQQTDEDRRLLEGLRTGDNKAFREVFELYSRQLYGYSCTLIHDQETSKDHVSEAFTTLFENRNIFTSLAHIRNFLYLSIRNQAFAYMRNLKNAAIKHSLAPRNEIEEPIISEIIQNELIDQLYKLLETLPKVQGEVIRKWIDEDKTLLEIAQDLNISPENAKVSRHRALIFLRTAAIVKKLRSRLLSIM